MHPEAKIDDALLGPADQLIAEIFERCTENAPNYGVKLECFRGSIARTIRKYVLSSPEADSSEDGISSFISQLQADELFLAIACANGNERAWWEFDQQHRSYLERVARHLAKTDIDAQEVVDQVYVDLYGQKIVDGERVSKFATYSGRGSLRGWLRTVIWHSLVDLHRASHDEVSLDEMTENVGEGMAHASFAVPAPGGEDEMLDQIETSRYRKATATAIAAAFASLDDHEKLLLLYYHVENLKLREIARLVEDEDSALRGWFQRRSSTRDGGGRTHESTVMRWLEKSYAKVLQNFKNILKTDSGLRDDEIAVCLELATNDLTGNSIFTNLAAN
jgi:RNA polymerase sigma-70 factor